MRDPRRRVLVTGFGPYPGVPENVSGDLALALRRAAQARYAGLSISARVLPTDWQAGPRALADSLAATNPDIALHFGVSKRAKGFLIESVGRNAAKARIDVAGALPMRRRLVADAPERLSEQVLAPRIAERLGGSGLPATLSRNAGGYLCNAIYYRSLLARAREHRRRVVAFVHLPVDFIAGETLSMADALRGSLAILDCCLDHGEDTLPRRAAQKQPGGSVSA